MKSPMPEQTSKFARTLTLTETYIQALYKHASTYYGGLVNKLDHALSNSDACIHNRKIELTHTRRLRGHTS
jgi:hypothetical protein